MIPLHKHSFSRIDLSTVLENMVENNIEGYQLGHSFATKLATLLGGSSGISVRNTSDALSCIVDLCTSYDTQGQKTAQLSDNSMVLDRPSVSDSSIKHTIVFKAVLLLPITIPQIIVSSLQRMQFFLHFYDVGEDAMTPLLSNEELNKIIQEHADIPVCLVLFYPFCISNHYAISLPSKCASIPTVLIGHTIPHAIDEIEAEKHESKINVRTSTNDTQEETISFYAPMSDFSLLIMEKNNVITSATGTILSIKQKKYKKQMKLLEQNYYLLPDFNAALAHSQLKQLDVFNKKCMIIKEHYLEASSKVTTSVPSIITEKDSVLQSFPLILNRTHKYALQFFKKQGIESDLFFKHSHLHYAIDQSPQCKDLYLSTYSSASKLLYDIIHVPLYPALSKEEVTHISKVIASLT